MEIPVVLCVDDEKIVLDSLKSQLEVKFNYAFQVETAQSGEEALELIEELISEGKEIPVVICDYLMPHMKGNVLLKEIKELYPSTSCILLTGQATLDAVKDMVNSGAIDRFIQKSWDIDLFSFLIEDILHKYEKNANIKSSNTSISLNEAYNNPEISSIKSYIKNSCEKINSALVAIQQNIETIKKASKELPLEDFKTSTTVESLYVKTSKTLDNILSEFTSIKKTHDLFPENTFDSNVDNDNELIYNCISNLMERVSNIEKKLSLYNEKIIVWKDDEMFVLNIHDIVYFTSGKRCTVAVTNNDQYTIKETLDFLENQLQEFNFFRCHRCYLVNINHIIKLTPWLGSTSYIARLKGLEDDIPVSKAKFKKLKEILGLESK
jgi:DNA-binding LytR/AlgR family response regulator